jgi:hypothetical protein
MRVLLGSKQSYWPGEFSNHLLTFGAFFFSFFIQSGVLGVKSVVYLPPNMLAPDLVTMPKGWFTVDIPPELEVLAAAFSKISCALMGIYSQQSIFHYSCTWRA